MVRWKKGRRVVGMLKVEERGYAIVDVKTGVGCAPNLFLGECRVTNTCTLCVFNLYSHASLQILIKMYLEKQKLIIY